MIKIIAGGKKSKNWLLEASNEYYKRLQKPFDAVIEFWSDEKIDNLASKWPFSGKEYVILLDERGKNISSIDLSNLLTTQFSVGKTIVFIIGGPFGVSEDVRSRADFVWSFSKLVFPHELMRLLLVEQIYRAQEIVRGGKYHHE